MIDEELAALSDGDRARLARAVMRRQGALSLRIAAVFAAIILGVPLVNAFLPGLASTPILGFTATWLFLGVLIYPVTVALSALFIRESDRIERECSDWRGILAEDERR